MSRLFLFAGSLLVSLSCNAALECPAFPAPVTQIGRDVKVEVNAAAGALGRFKAVELGTRVDTSTKALFEKFPNVDRLVLTQTLMATYCRMLSSANLTDKDRLARWETFQTNLLDSSRPDSPRSRSTAPSEAQRVKQAGATKPVEAPVKMLRQSDSKTFEINRVSAIVGLDLKPNEGIIGMAREDKTYSWRIAVPGAVGITNVHWFPDAGNNVQYPHIQKEYNSVVAVFNLPVGPRGHETLNTIRGKLTVDFERLVPER